MNGYNTVEIKICDESAGLVIFMANPDQLSALIHLFNFDNHRYDNVIVMIASGCASICRILFGELKEKSPRTVIGNVGIGSRIFIDSDLFMFTVTGRDFDQMLEPVDDCFLITENWKRLR